MRRARSKGTSKYCIALGLLLVVGMTLLLLQLTSTGETVTAAAPGFTSSVNHVKEASGDTVFQRPPLSPAYPGDAAKRAADIKRMREEFMWPENEATFRREIDRCHKLPQRERLMDLACAAVWFTELRNGAIIGVHEMWGFEETHWGAITLLLENGERALFKPCSTKSEDTTKEVIASALDQVFGYGQTAPVITRRIPVEQIRKFCVTERDMDAYNQTAELCSTEDGFFEGPVIGWWNNLTPIRTVRKYKTALEEMPGIRDKLSENLYTAQMQSRFHSFYWLINILRHGKDEFVTPEGNLISLDLDRSRYTRTKRPNSLSVNMTWCYTCYFDEETVNAFRAVGPNQAPSHRLGAAMNVSLHDEVFGNLWDMTLAQALDQRVAYYLECVDNCISAYGEEEVLLNVGTTMNGPELVDWYVHHSEYKDMNGKRGPDWFDWRAVALEMKLAEQDERRAQKARKKELENKARAWV